MTLTRLSVVLMVIGLSGCATSTPEFCDSVSWQERGYSQALTGGLDKSEEAGNGCAAKDAPLAYRIGFDYGLSKYCTFKRGMWAGQHGQGPAESCAEPQWDEYQNGYLTGHRIFEVNSRLEAISRELETTRSELWSLESAGEDPSSAAVVTRQARIEQLKQDREKTSRALLDLRAGTTGR